jgi:hypothetical protein
LQYWGLNSGPTPWATPPVLFCDGFFKIGSRELFYPGWLWTLILLIAASWVARIIGMSYWCPASSYIFKCKETGKFD